MANFFFRYWKFVKFHLIKKPEIIRFYAQNADRVATVANMLADEKSKITYLSIIKFRQTNNKNDFPHAHFEKVQYFIEELKFGKDEVFIDCGAFDGDTVDGFLECCSEYKQIIAFEPDTKNFEKLKEKHSNNPKITLFLAGVYDEDSEVPFCEQYDKRLQVNSQIIDELHNDNNYIANINIQVKAIDNLNLEKITFIKMDIEGAELRALKGAEKTILRDKPKLAICIYHSNEDMIDIAEYIHNLVPEYELYVRHHHPLHYGETVLYAIIQ
jgi:FkbM family methyltransferase